MSSNLETIFSLKGHRLMLIFIFLTFVILQPPEQLYKPHGNLVKCADPLCAAVQSTPRHHPCTNPNEQCDYEVQYADQGSSLGVLVRDPISLTSANGSSLSPTVAFG